MSVSAASPRKVSSRRGAEVQYAALPYRMAGATLEILLITSRRTHRWIIPKGWPIDGCTPHACAAREALEEAGVTGEIGEAPVGHFRYRKHIRDGSDLPCRVEVFALKVAQEQDVWAEKDARQRRWCTVGVAAAIVDEPQLRLLILKFDARVARERKHGRAPD